MHCIAKNLENLQYISVYKNTQSRSFHTRRRNVNVNNLNNNVVLKNIDLHMTLYDTRVDTLVHTQLNPHFHILYTQLHTEQLKLSHNCYEFNIHIN